MIYFGVFSKLENLFSPDTPNEKSEDKKLFVKKPWLQKYSVFNIEILMILLRS
jgi:hypothetical protein